MSWHLKKAYNSWNLIPSVNTYLFWYGAACSRPDICVPQQEFEYSVVTKQEIPKYPVKQNLMYRTYSFKEEQKNKKKVGSLVDRIFFLTSYHVLNLANLNIG